MDFAEKDWVSVVIEGSHVIVLARIATLKREAPVTAQETGGVLGMQLLQHLGGAAQELVSEFDLAFLQFKEVHRKIKSGRQGWNGVDIQPGKLLLVAAPPAAWRVGAVVEPSAVSEVDSAQAPLVQGITSALALAQERDPSARQHLLVQALRSGLPVLGSYAQFSMRHLQRLPRGQAIELEAALALDQSAPMRQRLSAAATLERTLWQDNSSGDVGNKRILSVLFVLMAEPQPDVHHAVMPMLYRLLITQVPEEAGAARDYRAVLLRGVTPPAENALRHLQEMREDASLGQEAAALLSTLTAP